MTTEKYSTEQENFWAGSFGDRYIGRNSSEQQQHSKMLLWGNMLSSANNIDSVMEFGCNVGLNLIALRQLDPNIKLTAMEIHQEAAKQAAASSGAKVVNGSILEPMDQLGTFDLTFTSGVLIHIDPDSLQKVYDNLYQKSNRYILVAEYYNPTPVSVNYRGNSERLFKRDFAGELIDKFNLKLVDYGFAYHRDNWMPEDDITWFLLEK